MIGGECSEWEDEGSCVAERTGMGIVASKVELHAHSAGLPGKEEFCFFVCPLSPTPRQGLHVALPFVTDAFKRLALVIGTFLLLATIPGAARGAEGTKPAPGSTAALPTSTSST